ncbi:Hypothetical protein I5071_61700 [Sandaracinus amylolyticus]|nr:Hypothetical protein I5071_61700 [Sandaracinus amylolyticus]
MHRIMDDELALTIRDAAARTGLSPHTLRYYERIGLLGRVPRASSGHRRYGERELRMIDFLRKLQATGMPIRDMLRYAALVRRGDDTRPARRALLEQHEARVQARLDELAGNLAIIRKKIAMYGEATTTKKKGTKTR